MHVFGLQGTDDLRSGALHATADALQSTIPHTPVKADPIDYDAAKGFINNPFFWTFLSRWDKAVARGDNKLEALLWDHLGRCEGEHIVVVGYSQGADAAARAWDTVITGIKDAHASADDYLARMDGLILFGHPRFNPDQRNHRGSSLDQGTFSGSMHGAWGKQGVETWSREEAAKHLMRSWCVEGDPVCNAEGPITTRVLTNRRFIRGLLGPHGSYPKYSAPTAGRQMGRWLARHYHGIR